MSNKTNLGNARSNDVISPVDIYRERLIEELRDKGSSTHEIDMLIQPESLELIRAYHAINNPEKRERLLEMAKFYADPKARRHKN